MTAPNLDDASALLGAARSAPDLATRLLYASQARLCLDVAQERVRALGVALGAVERQLARLPAGPAQPPIAHAADPATDEQIATWDRVLP